MAVGNGDTTQDTTIDDVQQQTFMMVYGTGEFYNGLTVMVGGYHYTTVGGALEGNSLQLMDIPQEPTPEEDNNLLDPTQSLEDRNPVVRLFQAGATPRYRRTDNNLLVPIGTPLHEHADGTIMLDHSMDDRRIIVIEVGQDELQGGAADNTTNQQNQQGGMNGNGGFNGNGGGMNGGGSNPADPNNPSGPGGGGTIIIDDEMVPDETNQGGGGNYGG